LRWWKAPVTSLASSARFVDLGDGIEGMIHIGDISRGKRLIIRMKF